MKYSNLKFRKIFLIIVLLIFAFHFPSYSNSKDDYLKLKAPIQESETEENIPLQIDLSTIPNFPKSGISTEGKRISASDAIIPFNTSLKLAVDSFIDAKTAMIGDYFKAHILEDFYIPAKTTQLILPKGSWVRGRISFLKRPNFFIKTAKIGIHLDELVTPLGEALVLDVELDVQKGIIGQDGLLKPSVIKQSDARWPDSILTVSINNLEAALINGLLTGKLYALFSQNDTTTLSKGQELQILLQRNVQFTVN